ncbi:g-D-glutamyl-meso-diaminopimelate peptidase [Oribacterium sp. KHPX15]|uniref:M14 family zinc carboxypeptidase n=1 Tax=Oribacterium sp. KHPX15 TaxID=1855342 RepID=UPI00089A3DE5|nr:M14 family zinc carboxypeptidase [Oribacterium sp. KHPX15]SEA43905.1 g-D-glutamyl-meso-diaminopimelate peptidase [Oribacterium sp. KHPX15]
MKGNISKVLTSILIAMSLTVSGTGAVAVAETGPARGAEALNIGLDTSGPGVPGASSASGESSGSSSSTAAFTTTPASSAPGSTASVLSPFNTNIYGTPVNGYYCDAVTTYTYENFESDISRLVSEYGSVVKSSVLGVSADNRNIYELIVGEPSAENQILLTGTTHGREYITSQLVMRQIHDLLSMAKNGGGFKGQGVASLLQTTCIHVIPMVNPDGAALSQFGASKVKNQTILGNLKAMIQHDQQRENYTGDTDWYYRRWKNNANGVDINRNFSIGWKELDDSRYYPSYEYYKGAAAESEAETQALIKVLNEASFDEVINYHAQGSVVYWSFGGAPEEVEARSKQIAELVKQDTGYILGAASTNKNSVGSGSYKEYLALKGIPSVTIEVGIGSCPLPDTDIDGIWQRNSEVLKDLVYEINHR